MQFSLYGKIISLYIISALSVLLSRWYVKTILKPQVYDIDLGYFPFPDLIYQLLFIIAVSVIYYRVTERSRNGSVRASLITSGFLCYFMYHSIYFFSLLYYNRSSYGLLGALFKSIPIILFAGLFVLSSIDLYNYYVSRDPVEIKSHFPGKRENLVPGWFFVLLIPLFCLMAILESFVTFTSL